MIHLTGLGHKVLRFVLCQKIWTLFRIPTLNLTATFHYNCQCRCDLSWRSVVGVRRWLFTLPTNIFTTFEVFSLVAYTLNRVTPRGWGMMFHKHVLFGYVFFVLLKKHFCHRINTCNVNGKNQKIWLDDQNLQSERLWLVYYWKLALWSLCFLSKIYFILKEFDHSTKIPGDVTTRWSIKYNFTVSALGGSRWQWPCRSATKSTTGTAGVGVCETRWKADGN